MDFIGFTTVYWIISAIAACAIYVLGKDRPAGKVAAVSLAVLVLGSAFMIWLAIMILVMPNMSG